MWLSWQQMCEIARLSSDVATEITWLTKRADTGFGRIDSMRCATDRTAWREVLER